MLRVNLYLENENYVLREINNKIILINQSKTIEKNRVISEAEYIKYSDIDCIIYNYALSILELEYQISKATSKEDLYELLDKNFDLRFKA
jgi:hypothetical protein